MKKFRVGPYASLVMDLGYVIQEKKWWGWSNWCQYETKKAAIRDAKKLEEKGYKVYWYIKKC